MQHALITGASTGIGRSAAKILAGHGWRVFASVRKPADADSLRKELGDKVVPLLFDVTDAAGVRAAADEVRAKLDGGTLNGLVNNAGIPFAGPLAHIPVDELRRAFEVNVFGAVTVTQAFIPLLGADRALRGEPGRIVNVSSTGGRLSFPFLAGYAMTKHALEAFGDGLRRELMPYGIDVVTIGPGSVVTPIWDKAEQLDRSRYATTDYAPSMGSFLDFVIAEGRKGLPVERVGEAIHHALTAPNPKARYAPVPKKFLNWTLPKVLPERILDRAFAKRFGLTRRA
jgi:NAD(P)-dependent dehydrogenase (short-subunit alcohol dehydrogenase family)